MSVNVLGQNVSSWAGMKHSDFSMLSLSHAHSEAYRAAVNEANEQSFFPPLSYHQHPSNSLALPYNYHSYLNSEFGSGLSPWNVLNVDGARNLGKVAGQKVPVSIVSSSDSTRSVSKDEQLVRKEDNQKTKSKATVANKRSELKPSTHKDFAKCQLSKAQMNGLSENISMTGSSAAPNSDHLAWLADVSTSRGNQRPTAREPASPGHKSTSHATDNSIVSSSGSLFRPPIQSAPSDPYSGQFALPGPTHLHRGSLGSDSNLAAYYNHMTPRYSPFYSPRYSPTGPYSTQSSPGIVPQQFFPMDTFSGIQSGLDTTAVPGGHQTMQLPHRSFSHGSQSYGLGKPNLKSHFTPDTGGNVIYDGHGSLKDNRVSKPNLDRKTPLLNPLTLKLSGKPLDPNGLDSRSMQKESGNMKHRMLRPGNITITEPPSSVMADAPLSAPPLRSTYQSDIPSPKYPRLSTPTSFPLCRQRSPLPPIIKLPKDSLGVPPVPIYVPKTLETRSSFGSSHIQFPAYFKKGSIIQLANKNLRRVEDLTTEDFLQSASLSPDLSIDSSTVSKIEESADRKSAVLGFSVGTSKVKVSVETPLEHPFFVFNRGWSSCSPERSIHQYGLSCQKLRIGDVCVSLTHKNAKSSINRNSPTCTSVTLSVTGVSQSILPNSTATIISKVLASTSERPKSSSTMPDLKPELPASKPCAANCKVEDTQALTSVNRKRRSSAPANINLDQMPLKKS